MPLDPDKRMVKDFRAMGEMRKKKVVKKAKKKIVIKPKKPKQDLTETIFEEEDSPEKKAASQPLVVTTRPSSKGKKQSPEPTPTQAKPENIFKFHCSFCGQKLSAAERSVSRLTVCPTCNNELKIPEPHKIPDAASRPDTDASDENAGLFHFFCIRCSQKLEARRDWSGASVKCAACGAHLSVPDPY